MKNGKSYTVFILIFLAALVEATWGYRYIPAPVLAILLPILGLLTLIKREKMLQKLQKLPADHWIHRVPHLMRLVRLTLQAMHLDSLDRAFLLLLCFGVTFVIVEAVGYVQAHSWSWLPWMS
jgi:hypothetical protein